jgi:HAD superfamily hydrolase (TIGR01549 family)
MVGVTSYFDGINVLAIDLVGTLVYKPTPHFYKAASDFLAKHGVQDSIDGFRTTFRRRYWEHSMGNYETDREFYSAVVADLSRTYDPSVEALTEIYVQSSPAFPEASQFLETMCQSYRLVLASNYVGPWAKRILESNGWLPHFHGSLVSSDCGFRKPSRQFFLELLKISGASPSEVLMIGDSVVSDVYGATAAGLRSVLLDRARVSGGYGIVEHVSSFSSLDELASTLASERIAPLRFEHGI